MTKSDHPVKARAVSAQQQSESTPRNGASGTKKNPAAVKLGKLGGKARAAKISKAQRIRQAKKAAKARWSKVKAK